MNFLQKRTGISLPFCIVTTLFWSYRVSAQALQIMPVALGMPNGEMSNTVFVTNLSTEMQTVQARPFLWSQSQSGDTLTPTDALMVSPPMTNIAPGAKQVFRILLRQPAEKVEASYRLLFDQLPSPADDIGGVRLTLRLSVPVFAQPPAHVECGLKWSVLVDDTGAVLHAENRGGKHVRIIHPVLNEKTPTQIGVTSAAVSYILAGAAQDWPIPGGQRLLPGSVLHLTATSDQGPVDATVHVLQR